MKQFITVSGARVHNLKNITLKIPKNQLTVITGLSGSGKSSLAFDTIYAEGQRRYVESLSSYARQFLGVLEKPDVDFIEGLSPAISIDQKSAARSPRSTVGTMSEIYDYLRLLYAKVGTVFCPVCHSEVKRERKPIRHKNKTTGQTKLEYVYQCGQCQHEFPEITMSSFSFNSPSGACPTCHGLGVRLIIDPELVLPNPNLTLDEGAIRPWSRLTSQASWYTKVLNQLSLHHQINLKTPVKELTPEQIKSVLYGVVSNAAESDKANGFEGVIPNLERKYHETDSEYVRTEIGKYMVERTCESCQGQRLRAEVLGITIDGQSIAQVSGLTISEAEAFFAKLTFAEALGPIVEPLLREIKARLGYLMQVGLDYLTLDRNADTLAGGEAQRIRLATQLGSALTGVLYILDEPSIGLHPRDQDKLINTMKMLRDLGNTVIVVEHDATTMLAADYLIDIGPGAGEFGGRVVAAGTPAQVMANSRSLTGRYLAGLIKISTDHPKRQPGSAKIQVQGATEFNLKNVTVDFPLQTFICVSGVSGSGKSTLVADILARALAKKFHHARVEPGKHRGITGLEHINKVIAIDQSPIGRTPRSNPATYTGVFTPIRQLFAETPLALERQYDEGHFSFNVKGGRCEACRGEGAIKIEMHFLPDIYVNCEECGGTRFNQEVLDVLYKGKNIADILNFSVSQARKFFKDQPAIAEKLAVLDEVGLSYMRLGQVATSLSGGEAQRVKLATELSRHDTGRTLYILDEPTSGLHFADIQKLLEVLQALVDKGNTVLVIEHNLDIIRAADWVIDMGPDGGSGGGQVVAVGTPETIANEPQSLTGRYLKPLL
ncbi:MAG: Excinuclease ABC subunit A [Candidatus Berkelbacteria bacterium Gr01-1014_85]|uniref:UvrABC system protein A n=1 Tax=Candidatus Berkelbacteria bacterium Gr01-1014_85 TaxID=2017150 RepID=A0A554JBR3_9BACT|nr:MAG: Excinuclease ABC subunit A [Candidatus Berkelbacteria bacterium Gr01-1014_85]